MVDLGTSELTKALGVLVNWYTKEDKMSEENNEKIIERNLLKQNEMLGIKLKASAPWEITLVDENNSHEVKAI